MGNGLKNSIVDEWEFGVAKFRGAPETAFSLELDYGEEKELIESDQQTLTAPSPIMFDDIHFGEYYDARNEIEGWNLPEFDDSNWKNVIKSEIPRGEARISKAEPIVVRNIINPVSVTECDGSYIYDFGVNTAGVCKLKIKGERGQKVLLRYFETTKDGKPYFRNDRFPDAERFQADEYYLSGNVVEEDAPGFTCDGFRYVLVTGITSKQATKELLNYLEMSSDLKSMGEFSCSDETVNKIQEATVRSDFSNFFYFPMDCPQREKNGWTADASLSAEQMLLNMNPENSYKEWMLNIYKALNNEGRLPGIVPSTGWGYDQLNGPAWDNVIVNLPYYTYIYRGDKEILEGLSIPLMRYLTYLYYRLNDKGLMEIGLGDWCQVGNDEWIFDTPLVVTDTIMTNDIANKAAFIYEVLGQEPQRQYALKLAETTRNAFRTNLIDENYLVKGNTQTAQAMAIYYGMFENEEKSKALEILLKYIDKYDGHFNTGVLGGRIIYRLLADNGYGELAYNMIVRPDFPSYGNWIERGATTLWEGFMPEGAKILSLNHHFWGDVSAWFYTYLAGIRVNPTKRDATNIDIKPLFIERLDSVKAHHNTTHGEISVNWIRIKEEITLTIECDNSLHGIIALPQEYRFDDSSNEKPLKSGVYKILRQGV